MLKNSHPFESGLFVKKSPQVSQAQNSFGSDAVDSTVIFQRGLGQVRLANCPTQPRLDQTLHQRGKRQCALT